MKTKIKHDGRHELNCNSERIPRSLLRGMRANVKLTELLTVEDSLQLAAGSFNP